MRVFKIRSSALGEIMSGSVGLTAAQQKSIDELIAKQATEKGLTEIQKGKLEKLIEIRDNPVLPPGAQTYCKKWVKEQVYQRKKHFSNKYTEKGIYMEDHAIDLVVSHYNYGYLPKNEQFFDNGIMTGTPDLILKSLIIDIKCSWDFMSFPLFEKDNTNQLYYWQLQSYMLLTGRERASLIYCLMDMPHNFIEKEAYYRAKEQGFDELDQNVFEAVKAEFTYSHYPDELRLKRYDFDLDPASKELIKERVLMCRDYIKDVLEYDGEKNTVYNIEKLETIPNISIDG